MERKVINLQKYANPGVGVLAGRDRGENARKEEQLDRLDRDGVLVTIEIPDEIYSVNSSFFLGMFDKSVQNLGAELFRARYEFVGPDAERTREEGIRKALLLGRAFRPRHATMA